jgi:hypothetical protein
VCRLSQEGAAVIGVLVGIPLDQGATEMSLPHLSTMYHDGSVLNGPARPRSTGELFAIRAAVRTRRQTRVRGT